jgi:hypothetical protein
MSAREYGCPREPELLEVLRAGAWPAATEEELRGHVTGCEHCTDLAEVATALLHDRDASIHEAPLPGSGLVWWKLQMRHRKEVAYSARRTLLTVQIAAVSIAGGVALVLLQLFFPNWVSVVASGVPDSVRGVAPNLLLGLLACLAVAGAPIAAYLVRRKS